MATLTSIRQIGDQLLAVFDDGSRAVGYPTSSGIFLVRGGTSGTDPSGGGSTGGHQIDPADDYPWPNATINTLSPLGYDYRECVDFVAWRLNRDADVVAAPWKYTWGGNLRPAGGDGDAIGWRHDWQLNGWPVDIDPVPGCVAWFSSEVGVLGHVAYVQAVNSDGTVLLEQYNWGDKPHAYSTRTCTTATPDSYLSIPPR